MLLAELLESLSSAERDYIAGHDWGQEIGRPRKELDNVISRGGLIDLDNQLWYPYECIELGKNFLRAGHEREYAACLGIVLLNMIDGTDNRNDIDSIFGLLFSGYRSVTCRVFSV